MGRITAEIIRFHCTALLPLGISPYRCFLYFILEAAECAFFLQLTRRIRHGLRAKASAKFTHQSPAYFAQAGHRLI